MKILSALFLCCIALPAADAIPATSRVFVDGPNGFDVYLIKALEAKKVPLTIVTDKDKADYQITVASESSQRVDLSKRIAMGINGKKAQADTVDESVIKVVNLKTGSIVFTYESTKKNAIHGKQSAAEDLAKHLGTVVK